MIDSVRYKGFGEEEMEKWKLVYKSSTSVMKTAKCIVNLESSDSDEEEETSIHKGPKKCMVVLDDAEED
jgi:hypothetical protein